MEQQVIAVMQADRCVGKLYERYAEQYGVRYQRWEGTVFGEPFAGTNLNDMWAACRLMAKERGLRLVKLVRDEGYEVVDIPQE